MENKQLRYVKIKLKKWVFHSLNANRPLVGYGEGVIQPLGLFNIHVVPEEYQEISLILGSEQEHITIISRANELVVSFLTIMWDIFE